MTFAVTLPYMGTLFKSMAENMLLFTK